MPTKDLAEHESIAWALTQTAEVVFVTADRRASLTALAELGRGRVAHPFDFWLHLYAGGLVNRQQVDALCDRTRRSDSGLPRLPPRTNV